MDNRDRQIAILNCNTVASQIAVAAGGTLLELIDHYQAAFEAVTQTALTALGQDAVMRAFPDAVVAEAKHINTYAIEAPSAAMPTISNGTSVRVVGTQHGDLPAWLIDACQKAGIEKVYDNRKDRDGNDQTGTKRPWFKEAVPKESGRDGLAFWPPKAR